MADTFKNGMRAESTSQPAYALDRRITALADDVRRAESRFFTVSGRQFIAITADGGPIAATPVVTPAADTASGANAVYVFALPR